MQLSCNEKIWSPICALFIFFNQTIPFLDNNVESRSPYLFFFNCHSNISLSKKCYRIFAKKSKFHDFLGVLFLILLNRLEFD